MQRDLADLRRAHEAALAQLARATTALQAGRADFDALRAKNRALSIATEHLEQTIAALDARLALERQQAAALQRETEHLRAASEALMGRRIAADIERIMNDLTLDQALAYGLDLGPMAPDQAALTMAGLIRTAKDSQRTASESQAALKAATLEVERLARRARKLEEQLAAAASACALPATTDDPPMRPIAIPPPAAKLAIPAAAARPAAPQPRQPPVPRPPAKFAAALKRPFEVPDGTGGTKKPHFR